MSQTYANYKPTSYDSHIPLEDREDWLVLPTIRTRDSSLLELSNFDAALKMFPDGQEYPFREELLVETHEFNHWACGWYEIILVHPDHESLVIELEEKLESYPILNEDDYSEREYDNLLTSWESWGRSEFVRTFQKIFECSDTLTEFLETNLELYHLNFLGRHGIHRQFNDSHSLSSEIRYLIETDPNFDRSVAAKWILEIRANLKSRNTVVNLISQD